MCISGIIDNEGRSACPICKQKIKFIDDIPLVFNQMIAFVQSAEVERFADRFYANPDSQYLTVVASPQDQAVVVYEGIDFFDSYQREHKGDEK